MASTSARVVQKNDEERDENMAKVIPPIRSSPKICDGSTLKSNQCHCVSKC